MPIKNRTKQYKEGAIYHIYNRGIDGREVFKDEQDYQFFTDCLKNYLLIESAYGGGRYKSDRPYLLRRRRAMNLNGEIEMLSYCLLLDHFHLLVYQGIRDGITKFMRRVMTRYVMYFNRKYKRRGVLFENVYRAVSVGRPELVLGLSKFIHMNPAPKVVKRFGIVETTSATMPEFYPYSSYGCFVGDGEKSEWVNTERVVGYLVQLYGNRYSYKDYMDLKTEGWDLPLQNDWEKVMLD